MRADGDTIVRAAFEGFLSGEPDALADRLAPDAEWLWYRPSECDCHSREEILATLAKRQRRGIVTRIVDVRTGTGDEVLVRWFDERMERKLRVSGGIASLVVTVRDGRIVRMRDCTGYEQALAVAGLGES
jgi:ketosteroid isomerase-like protein